MNKRECDNYRTLILQWLVRLLASPSVLFVGTRRYAFRTEVAAWALRGAGDAVLPANFYINVQQMLHNYICCNIKVQQMLQFVLFNLWRFRSKCWTIYIDYKHSVAAAFIMAPEASWVGFFREI